MDTEHGEGKSVVLDWEDAAALAAEVALEYARANAQQADPERLGGNAAAVVRATLGGLGYQVAAAAPTAPEPSAPVAPAAAAPSLLAPEDLERDYPFGDTQYTLIFRINADGSVDRPAASCPESAEAPSRGLSPSSPEGSLEAPPAQGVVGDPSSDEGGAP
jgi:hypothetical protein